MKQLGLFAATNTQPPSHLEADQQLLARLPRNILLGPSSWTFPGWEGIVYPRGMSRDEIIDRGLEVVAQHPLFRTVGIDRSHYMPLDEATLRRYHTQLPAGFPCVIKAWGSLSTLIDTRDYSVNPTYLDPAVCEQAVLLPLARCFHEHTGPIVFQFAPIPARYLPPPDLFAEQIDRFFAALSTAFRYAVEIRNRELLTPAYLEALSRHGVAHVLNFWERMPSIGEQLAMPSILRAPFVVTRLSIPPDNRYEEQKKRFMPFNRIAMADEVMRADVVALARAARALNKTLFITANNKVEGCSPLTIRALIERIVADIEA